MTEIIDATIPCYCSKKAIGKPREIQYVRTVYGERTAGVGVRCGLGVEKEDCTVLNLYYYIFHKKTSLFDQD